MGILNKATDTAPYMRLKSKIDELKSDPRYQFMFSGMLIADTMAASSPRSSACPPRASRSRSSTSRASLRHRHGGGGDAVAPGVRLRHLVAQRSAAPVLLVCEEAHRYMPRRQDRQRPGGAQGAGADRQGRPQIRRSPRPHHQRPSDLAEGVLSQCGTIIAMRLNNERDQQFVKSAMPEGARGFLDVIPALRNRECIVCGEGVSIPIRVSFDDLERDRRPASSTRSSPSFGARAATRKPWSAASSSAGAARGADASPRSGTSRRVWRWSFGLRPLPTRKRHPRT
jgi:hypothetical protein